MGTRAEPKVSPSAVSLTAGLSYDPDGSPLRFAWKLAGTSGGSVCPGGILVLFGKETDKPSLPIPKVSARPNSPMSFTFLYRVIDEMYNLSGTVVGYGASPNGCDDSGGGGGGGEENPPPEVSVSASATEATGGDVVILTGVVDDPEDTHTVSWMQLDNTTPVALSSTTDSNTAFVAPNVNTLLKFRFTATDSAEQSASADIAVLVSGNPDGGGGGESGDGGSGDGGSGDGGSGDGGSGDGGSGDGGSGDGGSGDGGSAVMAEVVMAEAVMVEAVMAEVVTVEAVMAEVVMAEVVMAGVVKREREADPLPAATQVARVSICLQLQLCRARTPSRKLFMVRFTPAQRAIRITLQGPQSTGRPPLRESHFCGRSPMAWV